MSKTKKRVLSCIQPTGDMHIGNYFGAVKNWARIQDEGNYNCIYGIVDLHAMTMPYKPDILKSNTLKMAVDLMACGIDPEKSILFIQSLVPEHTELTWIFNCVTSYGELMRMTQFKDKSEQLESSAKGSYVSAGLFTYPVLQAADILIYLAELVPVGKDQEQHLELSRNIAVRFNAQFGKLFPEPQPLFTEIPKLVSLADPSKKMSKSLGEKHYIGLFEDEASIRKKVRTAVTDAGNTQQEGEMSPGVKNLFAILKSCNKDEIVDQFTKDFNDGTLKYANVKDAAADSLVELTSGLRAKREELGGDTVRVTKLIHEMSDRAREIAQKTLREARELTGLAH